MLYQLSYRPLLITTLNTAPRAASGGLPYCSAHARAFSRLSWSVVGHGFRLAAGLLPGDSPTATAKPRRSAAEARKGRPTRTVHTICENALKSKAQTTALRGHILFRLPPQPPRVP